MAEPVRKKQKLQKASKVETVVPKSTLYINNLPDGLRSYTMRENLYLLFSIYGEVLKISVNTKKMRGQAFIKMRTVDEANLAMISLNDELFFGKQLKINFSKAESNDL